MSRIIDAFRWEYGLQWRHGLLILAAGIGTVDLYIANLTGSVPTWLALAAISSPLIGLGAVLRASLDEQITLAVWSLASCIGLGITNLALHRALASSLTSSHFQTSHPIGLAVATVMSVVMVLFGIVVVLGTLNAVRQWRTDGNGGGATPEERVLSEEEYADFEPICNDTLPDVTPYPNGPIRHTPLP